jgi:hypothetical protein
MKTMKAGPFFFLSVSLLFSTFAHVERRDAIGARDEVGILYSRGEDLAWGLLFFFFRDQVD